MSWEKEMAEATCDFPTCERQAYQRGLQDARKACIAELLSDPQDDEGDRAYDRGVRDCVSAIEKMYRIEVAPSDSSCTLDSPSMNKS